MRRDWWRLGLLPAALLAAASCNTETKLVGQVVISVETDMAMPRAIDSIHMQVVVRGTPLLDQSYPVGGGPLTQSIPATLALLAGQPTVPVTIRVRGEKAGVARTLREATTIVPQDRRVLLRMPVQWLCDESVQASASPAGRTYASTCGEGFTCAAGRCVPQEVDSATLPNYDAKEVYGGSTEAGVGRCFDTVACLARGTVVEPDASCTIPKPQGTSDFNVGLRIAEDGICDLSGRACFVPLNARSVEGWVEANDRVALPPAACERLRRGKVRSIVVSTSCPAKTESTPPCGEWSSVVASDAGVPGEAGAPFTGPELYAELGRGASRVCCPLLSDASRLITCTCNDAADTPAVEVLGVDTKSKRVDVIGRFVPSHRRRRLSATISDGAFIWTDRTTDDAGVVRSTVERTVLGTAPTTTRLAVVDADVYDESPILGDATSNYVFANNVRDARGQPVAGAPVQILRVDRAVGSVVPFDTGSALPVFQFADDGASLYVATLSGGAPGADAGVEARSGIRRIVKASGAVSTVYERSLPSTTSDASGFLGVQVDANAIYAIHRGPPADDGQVEVLVVKVSGAGGTPTPLYQRRIDPRATELRMLGVVDGTLLLVRTDSAPSDAGMSVTNASLIALPTAGGDPRIVADFLRDAPAFGFQAPTFDPDGVYWLTTAGSLYRVPRSAIRG